MIDEPSHLDASSARPRVNPDAVRPTAVSAPPSQPERLLVCVGPSPTTTKLLYRTQQMAKAFGCPWLAVAVSSGVEAPTSDERRQRISRNLQLAERLGAETHTLIGLHVADTVLAFARSRNVTKIVVGKTAQPWWRQILFGTVVDELLEHSGAVDIYVIRGEGEADESTEPLSWRPPAVLWKQYLSTTFIVAGCGLIGRLSQNLGLAEANIVMIFLLGVVLVATRYSRGPAIVAAIANVLVFDFFFVPPQFSFTVYDAQYLLTFGVMLGIGLLVSTLTARVHEQLSATQQQERRASALYRLTKQLSEVYGSEFLIRTAGRQLAELFSAEVVIFLRSSANAVELRFGETTPIATLPENALAARWATEHREAAGAATNRFPTATALFVPLVGSQQTVGAIGVHPTDASRFLDPEQRRLLATCASLIALAIERDQSVLDAQQAQVQVKTEQLRNSLLSSVSHDLRTPLAAMAGAATSLMSGDTQLSDTARRELLQSIVEESLRLSRLVDNLLDMTRLQSGGIHLKLEWHVLEEIVGSALQHVRGQLARHSVSTWLPSDLPLMQVDGVLFEQVFVNLLENAARYTPAGSVVEITAHATSAAIEIRVTDNGPGLPPGTESQMFEKFVRGESSSPDGRRGVGLGLAICRGIVQAHGGSIVAHNRATGGAEFVITLPCRERPPDVRMENVPISSPLLQPPNSPPPQGRGAEGEGPQRDWLPSAIDVRH